MVSVIENQIARLYVDPTWHRMGYGRRLFEEAVKTVKGKGYAIGGKGR